MVIRESFASIIGRMIQVTDQSLSETMIFIDKQIIWGEYTEIPKHAGSMDKSGKTLVSTGPTVRYKILGMLYRRALFDLQFVHNLFWL